MSTYTQLQRDFQDNVIGYSAIGTIISTCLGGFAIMQTFAQGSGILQFLIIMAIVMVCSAHNAAILTVQKPRLIFRLLVASTLFNSLIIIASLFI